ncbi:hypothetical protein J2Z42_000198 [Clostridium algifaecis]|uniref:Uncharacterized protein n=1 Tax=Clostridium algifaecis TaxID=1472040 RepID=A0ABS4KNB3_9CLOT|nr:hypothetical protein [Clostridium algifaecis]MBP2031533.1 hypothetical protein [Clostridium algifaecis]
MEISRENFYIIEQSSGNVWYFYYNECLGIVYRIFKENLQSNYQLVTDTGTKNFSVVLFPDDTICVLYEDINGEINLTTCDGETWSEQKILKNIHRELFSPYFKAVVIKNKLYIIYSILNKITGISTLFHQTFDGKNNLSSPKIIDTVKFNYNVPFNVYVLKNKKLFIMYQRLINNHQLGYKVFDDKHWSKFYIIDKSIHPYKNYSIIIYNHRVHSLYIRSEKNNDKIIYTAGTNANFKYTELAENQDIISCTFFITHTQIWCSWIQHNKIFSSFSIDNGNSFSNPPYSKLLSSNIVKWSYSTNRASNINDLILKEVYISPDEPLKYLIISDIYSYDNNVSYKAYFINKIVEKILKKMQE